MREGLKWLETCLTPSQLNCSGKGVNGTNIYSSILHTNNTFYCYVIPIYTVTVGSLVVMACWGSASKDWHFGVILVHLNVKLRSKKENRRNRIAGSGMSKQLVIAGEAGGGTCPSWWRRAYAIPGVGWRVFVGSSLPCMTWWAMNLVCQTKWMPGFKWEAPLGWGYLLTLRWLWPIGGQSLWLNKLQQCDSSPW